MITSNRLRYPENLGDANAFPATIQFQFYRRNTLRKVEMGPCIALYLPESISNPSTVSFDAEKLGFVVGTAVQKANAAGAGAGASDILFDSISSAAGKLASHGLSNLMAKGTTMLGSNATSSDLMGLTTGVVENPYYTMLFRGVDLRSFSFDFMFTPHSENECQNIDNVIRTFREHYLPNKTNEDATFLGYPDEVEVSYWWKGKPSPWMHKHKRAVITYLDENLTPQGVLSVKRGAFPTVRTMSIKFSEMDIVTREDIKDGY